MVRQLLLFFFSLFSSLSFASDKIATEPALPHVGKSADLFLFADFIYWKIREDGLAFAASGVANPPDDANQGTIYSPYFDWDPGFKVGIGLRFDHDGWDLLGRYTRIRSSPLTKSVLQDPSDPNDLLTNILIFSQSGAGRVILFGSGQWKLIYNMVDLELGKDYFITSSLSLRPFVGLKGGWQEDHYTARYRRETPNQRVRLINNIDVAGIGLRFGSNNFYRFIKNFGLFIDWAFSALSSRTNSRQEEFLTPDLNFPEQTFRTVNSSSQWFKILPCLELNLGLRIDHSWKEEQYHLSLSAGWEEQFWFGYNQHFNQSEETAHGDLHLQGLTLKARLDF